MRISVLLAITTMGLAPALLSAQQWTLEGDVALRSRYEWRGLALDPGHNLQYSAYASVAWDAASVTFGVWSLADLSTNPSAGLPERWGFETSPWLDATLGDDRRQLVVGITGYDIGAPSGPEPLRRSDTWEIYAGGRGALPGAPVVGEAVVYWDMGRVGGAYAEVAGALQIPVWAGLIVPVGSIFLEGRTGFALGQERGAGKTDPRDFHFEGGGLTHLDVSLRTTLLPVPLGPVTASLTLESHWVTGFDPETERVGVTTGGAMDQRRWWWGLGLRLAFPRCRPDRELCRDL